MKLSLTLGLNEQEKEDISGQFKASFLLRQQLTKILNDKISATNKAMRALDEYNKSSWPMYQADRLGQIRAYEEIISLLEG